MFVCSDWNLFKCEAFEEVIPKQHSVTYGWKDGVSVDINKYKLQATKHGVLYVHKSAEN